MWGTKEKKTQSWVDREVRVKIVEMEEFGVNIIRSHCMKFTIKKIFFKKDIK